MREDLVTLPLARRLERAGLEWEPLPGDWCAVLGGEHLGEARVGEAHMGLWLVAALALDVGLLGVVDSTGRWPMVPVARRDCVWVPSVGKLKTWLRARGYRVATSETEPLALGAGSRHVCRLMRAGDASAAIAGDGTSEAEATAEALLRVVERAGMEREYAANAAMAAPGFVQMPPQAPLQAPAAGAWGAGLAGAPARGVRR
jgi:hypothetical protein